MPIGLRNDTRDIAHLIIGDLSIPTGTRRWIAEGRPEFRYVQLGPLYASLKNTAGGGHATTLSENLLRRGRVRVCGNMVMRIEVIAAGRSAR